jgi:hypothetical protein
MVRMGWKLCPTHTAGRESVKGRGGEKPPAPGPGGPVGVAEGSLLGVGLAVLGLLSPTLGQLAPVGGQGLAAGHVPGHIG